MDHENTVKAYSSSLSMLGRGHSLVEQQGPVWVRWVATDGTCSTTNSLRRMRCGGTVVCISEPSISSKPNLTFVQRKLFMGSNEL